MKKFFLVLFAVLLVLSFTACRNVVYIPIGVPGGGDNSENTGGDEEAERAENLQAAGETLAGIETLFQSYIDEGRKADTYTEGSKEMKGSIPVGQTLTFDFKEDYPGWTYSFMISDRAFSVDMYVEKDGASRPQDMGEAWGIYDGVVLVSYYKEGQSTDDGTGPLGENALGYGEDAVRIEFKELDYFQMMLNMVSIMTSDKILINGKTIAASIQEDSSIQNKLGPALLIGNYSLLGTIDDAFSYYNSFTELENHPGFGESHKLNEFVFTEDDGLSYSYIWDYPNTGLSALDFSVSDGSLEFHVSKQLRRNDSAVYSIEKFKYNGISYTESELEGLMIGEMSASDYVIEIFDKANLLNINCHE